MHGHSEQEDPTSATGKQEVAVRDMHQVKAERVTRECSLAVGVAAGQIALKGADPGFGFPSCTCTADRHGRIASGPHTPPRRPDHLL